MRYGLGVDLGTTFTAVALSQEGHVEMVGLGERTVVTPSVVFARESGPPLIGDAAVRRELGDPDRAGREFKRRLGDPSPLLLGGTSWSPAMLMGTVLRDVLGKAEALQGGSPERLVLTHPAVWGPYRREQFGQVPQMCGLTDVTIVTEPVAAATYYTSRRGLAEGDVLAVYDLGGGTFDATVVRMHEGAMQILGEPEGLEWLGGIDFDETIFAFLDRSLDGRISALNPNDPANAISLARIRQECVLAKEALSVDDEVLIQAFLPDGPVSARLTRAEFETFIRPAVTSTVEAMHRALKSAQIAPDQLASVLLVGGSSRIPLVAELLEQELGRPTVVDAHPKHSVALGAAVIADQIMRTGTQGAVGTRISLGTTLSTTTTTGDGVRPTLSSAPPVASVPASPVAPAEVAPRPPKPPQPRRKPRKKRPSTSSRPANRTGPVVVAVLVVMAVIGVVIALLNRPDDGSSPGASASTSSSSSSSSSASAPSGAGFAPTVRKVVRSLGERPQGAAFTADGKRVYVASVVSSTVEVIDAADDSVAATISLPVPPQYVVTDPDRPRAYVTMIDPKGKNSALAVIDTDSNRLIARIPVGASPLPPAVSPDGSSVWVPDRASSSIWIVDLASSEVTRKIDVPGLPSSVTFQPGGRYAYVTNFESEKLSVYDTSTGALTAEVRVGVTPIASAVSRDGRWVAVANYDSHSVSLVDTATTTVRSTITVGNNPQSVAFAPDGARLYVVNSGSGTLSAVDVARGTPAGSVAVGKEPWWVTVSPDGKLLYTVSAADNAATALTPK